MYLLIITLKSNQFEVISLQGNSLDEAAVHAERTLQERNDWVFAEITEVQQSFVPSKSFEAQRKELKNA